MNISKPNTSDLGKKIYLSYAAQTMVTVTSTVQLWSFHVLNQYYLVMYLQWQLGKCQGKWFKEYGVPKSATKPAWGPGNLSLRGGV